MIATPSPSPFDPSNAFYITVQGGTPPYEFVALPAPPNPDGVKVVGGNPAAVRVPSATPRGTVIYVNVQDSSTPPQTVLVTNTAS